MDRPLHPEQASSLTSAAVTRSAAIETIGLCKTYGKRPALDGLSLSVPEGEIFGLLGPNGAGKTTFLKILLGMIRDFRGQVHVLGRSPSALEVRRQIGFLPEDHAFPDYHTASSLLDFYGTLSRMDGSARRAAIPRTLELVGLDHVARQRIGTFSKGMRQRLGIAQAILHDPRLIILDEPTEGIDPVGRRQIRELLGRLKGERKTILITSHVLSEVEHTCERVAIMGGGKLVREGNLEELTRVRGRVLLTLVGEQTLPVEALASKGYRLVSKQGEHWELALPESAAGMEPLLDLLHSLGVSVREVVERRKTLEDLFLEAVGAGPR